MKWQINRAARAQHVPDHIDTSLLYIYLFPNSFFLLNRHFWAETQIPPSPWLVLNSSLFSIRLLDLPCPNSQPHSSITISRYFLFNFSSSSSSIYIILQFPCFLDLSIVIRYWNYQIWRLDCFQAQFSLYLDEIWIFGKFSAQ